VSGGRADWRNTTHDWSADVDHDHLERIRRDPRAYSPGGPTHLVLEVLAYAVDEAEYGESPAAIVTLHPDGSISVSDNGRGTDTRPDGDAPPVRKPVMSTQDLRFFESASAPVLSDGYARRGLSVVSALSTWLVHTNRRQDGSWTQRYELGRPVSDLVEIPDDGSTGTTVHFRPDPELVGTTVLDAGQLRGLVSPARLPGRLVVQVVPADR
jgi:topoisomerase IV subunit B